FFRAVAGPGGRTYHQAMTDTSARSGRNRGRGVSVVLGIILLVLAVVAVLAGRGTITIPGFGQDDNAAAHLSDQSDLTTVQAVIGSEKKAFFDDPGVRDVFAEHGYRVEVTTAGSRRIATDTDLSGFDFAFP